MHACYFSMYFNPFTCSPVFQGTLKEKTVENLEKYVVRDVSTHINILSAPLPLDLCRISMGKH